MVIMTEGCSRLKTGLTSHNCDIANIDYLGDEEFRKSVCEENPSNCPGNDPNSPLYQGKK